MHNYDDYDSVLSLLGEIPGWEVMKVEHGADTQVTLTMKGRWFVVVVLAPTGAYAVARRAYAISRRYDGEEGPLVFVRGKEFAAAVWMAHAETFA